MIREGGCLCGAVRFKAEGEPLNVRICHCRNCQKAMGSPYFARALFDQSALDGRRRDRALSDVRNIDRVFCPRCGTRLFSWRRNGTAAGVALADLRRSQRLCADRAHLGVGEDGLGLPR